MMDWTCKGSKAGFDVNFPLFTRKSCTGIGYFLL